jgi:type I restriction enzyme S subunit
MSEPFGHETVESLAGPWKGSIKIGPFGSQLKREDMVEKGHKVYGQENVIAEDWSVGDRRVSGAKFNALRSCELHAGDVVLSMMGTVGKCGLFPTGAEPGLMDSHLLRIQPNPELVTREYLVTVLQAENVVGRQIAAMSHGSIMAGLSSSIVRRFTVPLPPLNEQPILSAILDTLDTTIRQTEAIIEKFKQIKQGLLHDLLTRGIDANGELRPPQSQAPHLYKDSPLGRIPSAWQVQRLANFMAADITYGIVQAGPHIDGGVPYVRTGDMSGDRLIKTSLLCTSRRIADSYRRSEVRAGDIVMAIRATVGKVLPVPPDLDGANLTQGTARLAPNNRTDAEFLLWAIRHQRAQDSILAEIKGTTFAEITLAALREVPLAAPISIDEQRRIGERMAACEERIRQERRQLQKLRAQKSGLMDDLLTGRVRVTPLLA